MFKAHYKNYRIVNLTVIILLVAGIFIFIGNKTIEHPDVAVQERDDQGRPIVQIHTDEDVVLMGGGVEYLYYGDIKPGKPVQIVYTSEPWNGVLTITGSVNQTINSADETNFPSEANFLDLSSGSQAISVDTDYNFDGYSDLYMYSSVGHGTDAVISGNAFLYDSTGNKFVYNAELSNLQNVSVNSETKRVIEDFSYNYDNKYIEDYRAYKWVNGHLVKVK